MKAVVLKTDGKRAAVMDGDGSVRIIENRDYSRGQVLEIEAQELPYEDGTPIYEYEDKAVKRGKIASIGHFIYRHASQAAAVAAVVIIAGGMSVYAAPVKTVTSATTPSLSYKLNVFDRVVRVEAADDPEEELPEGLMSGVAGQPFDKAVDIARDTLEKTEQKKAEEAPEEEAVPETKEQVIQIQPEISLQENSGAEQLQTVQAPEVKAPEVPGSTTGDDDDNDDNDNGNSTEDNKADKDDSDDSSSDGNSNNNSGSGASFGAQGSHGNKITSADTPSTGTGLPAGPGSDAGPAGQTSDPSPSGSAPVTTAPTGVPDNSNMFMTVPGVTTENANYGILDIAPPSGYGTGAPGTGGGSGDTGGGGAPESGGDHAPEGGHSEGGGQPEGGSDGGPEGGHGDGGGPGGGSVGRR